MYVYNIVSYLHKMKASNVFCFLPFIISITHIHISFCSYIELSRKLSNYFYIYRKKETLERILNNSIHLEKISQRF